MDCRPQLPIDTPEAEARRRAALAYPPERRLEDARRAIADGEPRALLAALGITPDRTTAELWGPLLTKLLGGSDELAAIRWSVDIGRRMVEGTPTLAEYTGDLAARLDAAHRFLREVAS